MPKGRTPFIVAASVLALLVVATAAFAGPLSRAFVAALLDAATGDRVAFDTLDIRGDRAIATGITLVRGGATLLTVRRVALRYHVRDLFPGAARRYGLEAVDVEGPRVTLVRRADGTFDVASLATTPGSGPASATQPVVRVPLRFDARVHDGSLRIKDRFRVLPESRRLEFDGLDGTLAFDSAGVTVYRLHSDVARDRGAKIDFSGRIDVPRGFAQHRLQAKALDIVPFVNYFINSQGARFGSGFARRLDLRAYGFASKPGGAIAYHVAGSLELASGSMRIPGLVATADAMAGRVDLFDGGFAAPALAARVGGIAARIAGGLYDWNDLQFRLGIALADAPLGRVKTLFAFSRKLPVAGDARLETLLEGPAGLPLIATRIDAPRLAYGIYPLTELGARAIFYDGALDVVGLGARYGGLAVAAGGSIRVGATTRSQLVVDVTGPASRVPYLAEVAPLARVEAIGLLAGPGLRLDARGVIAGEGGGAVLDGVFHEDERGDGSYGPFTLARSGGASIAGAFTFNRSAGESAFWLAARDYPYAALAVPVRLPGIDLVAPTFGGRLDGSVAGSGPPSDFRIAGDIRGRDLRVGGIVLASVAGHVVGRIGNFGLGDVAATGPWGSFAGHGAYVGPALALEGTYRGSFAQLRTFTGNLGASGPVDGPIALEIGPHRTIVQAIDARTPGARIAGVPVDGLSGTLAVTGKRVDIYAASGAVAGGTLVAAGNLETLASLGVSLAGADATRLRSVVPLGGGGRIAAIGTFGAVGRQSRFDGGLELGEGTTLDRLPVAANGDVTLGGTTFAFRQTDAQLGAALGSLDGRITDVGTRVPHYDARLQIAEARLGPFVRAAQPQRRDIAGTLTGDLHVSGTPATLAVAGRIGLPEGTINGLAFRDAAATVAIAPGDLTARAGTVTVGSTATSFGADVHGNDASFHLDAPRADLGDFNDYYDAGDTLGGRGRNAADYQRRGTAIRTSADIAIAGLHVRRFDLGDATARWTSRGGDVTGKVAFGGASGRLDTAGTLGLPAHAPLNRLLERSRFTGTARLRGLDLGVWLPAIGYQVPVGGRVDADATIAGPLRNPDVRTTASLVGGSLGSFPVERLTLAATSTLRRTTVSAARLDVPGLALVASGSFGFGERDRIALAVHVKSPSVSSVAGRLFGTSLPVTGAAEIDVKVEGTRVKPRVAGGFDLEAASLRGVAVPRALGQFSLAGRDIVLTSVEVGFATGTLFLAGSVPLQVAPFGFGPASAPISLELAAKGIDFADFAPLLPKGSALGGKLDGRVVVGGTAGAPRLVGELGLSGGRIVAPFETQPLTNVAGTLAFSGTDARLVSLHANAGGGTLDATGEASLSDLVDPGNATAYNLRAEAKHLHLNLPAYGDGQIDGKIALVRKAGARPRLGGTVALRDAVIPFAALLLADNGSGAFAAAPAPPPKPQPGDLALDLTIGAANNVRVRSSNVDIGAKGDLHVGGTSRTPKLDGGFDSTGGTLTYFNTVFRILDARVSFFPDAGFIPTLDAKAITHVIDPDPNTVRNLAGSADVTLDLTGPVTNLTIGLSSDPSYDRQQILGLLLSAPALGASIFGETAGTPTLYGSTTVAGAPAGSAARSNGTFSVAQEAFGIANAQFTRTLLAPIETSFAQAVGLSNFNVNVDYTGNVGVTARKVLGKKINAVYGTSFGYPYRQSFGFEIKPNDSTAAQLTVFQTLGATGLTSIAPAAFGSGGNFKLQAAQPSSGTTGFSLSLQRLFR